ncbi:MAG: DUF4350 domain-containing protein [Bacteroidota bacterium]|nr:DUF4350 domain-containing protein [Bacteroidota bacterium]
MFKGNKKFIYIFVGIFIVIVAIQYLLPKPTDWSRTYLNKSKTPFGCYAIYNLIEGTYTQKLNYNNQTLYNLNDKKDTSTSLLIINDNINFNKSDIKSLYDFLERGNTLFIAANNFNGAIADSLHIRTQYNFGNYFTSVDSLLNKTGECIKFTAKNLVKEKYSYSQLATFTYFETFDSTRFKVLAYYQNDKACLIHGKLNKGQIYLMSIPDVFGNYYVVNHNNKEVPFTLLSLIKNKQIVWDEYYKTFNITNYSIFKFIFESDALYAAYLLLIFTIIFYMIFEGRRRQRAVPKLAKPTNSTLEFVNVISHVYYNSKNHQSIALERIKFFYETVRKKFNVSTNDINELFIDEVTELSGIERKLVNQLFIYCEKIKKASEITEYDLIELNRQIHNFNKNSLR